jgi:hypothetical protein
MTTDMNIHNLSEFGQLPIIDTSVDTDGIYPALICAQGECSAVVTDASNPQYKSKYTTLSACLETVLPVAARHGLGFLTSCQALPDGKILAITKLFHASGQWIQITLPMKPTDRGDSNQALGSILSYARRYSISSLFALRQTDDDANMADGLSGSNVETPKTAAKVSSDDAKVSKVKLRGNHRIKKGLELLSEATQNTITDKAVTELLKGCSTVNEACRAINASRLSAQRENGASA